MQHVVRWVREPPMVCLKVWMEYLFGSPDGRFGAKISVNYEDSRSIPSREECEEFLSVLQLS